MTRQAFAKRSAGVVLMVATVACGGSAERLTGVALPPSEGGGTLTTQSRLDLVGAWQLVSVAETGNAFVTVGEPERFTAEFGADGRVSLRADCNRGSGGYTATASALTVGPMACTRAYCSSAPLDMTFTKLVSEATTWTAAKGSLKLRSDSGVLRLRK